MSALAHGFASARIRASRSLALIVFIIAFSHGSLAASQRSCEEKTILRTETVALTRDARDARVTLTSSSTATTPCRRSPRRRAAISAARTMPRSGPTSRRAARASAARAARRRSARRGTTAATRPTLMEPSTTASWSRPYRFRMPWNLIIARTAVWRRSRSRRLHRAAL